MKLEDETKMSKAKTRDIEQLTRQKKGKLQPVLLVVHAIWLYFCS